MLADPERILERAANPDGTRRFYPPGAHPGTHRMREQLFVLERLRERTPVPAAPELDENIEYLRLRLARFEIAEDAAKARHLLVELDRHGALDAARAGL